MVTYNDLELCLLFDENVNITVCLPTFPIS